MLNSEKQLRSRMNTKYAKIDPQDINSPAAKAALEKAGEIIRAGGLVAFPTETVYGLGGDAENREASKKIYAAKGRPSDNPLIVHICELGQLKEIAAEYTDDMQKLADAFWPGPLTIIVNSSGLIPHETTGGLDTVAVRFPSHPVANALIRVSGTTIAAPSANTSGRPSPTRASHVKDDLDGKIDMIIDGGPVDIGLESTIVDLTEDTPTILRPGYITPDDVKRVLGSCRIDPGITNENPHVRPKAPGMRYRHYAPKAALTIVEGSKEKAAAAIAEYAIATASGKAAETGLLQGKPVSAGTGKTGLLQGKPVSAGTGKTGLLQGKPVSAGTGKTGLLQDKPVSAGTGKTGLAEGALTPAIKQVLEEEEEGRPVKTAIICSSELADAYRKDGRLEACGVDIISLGAEGNDDEIAANLFAVLRKCDDDGIERIFSESFENGRIGGAIMNRLIKAAGHDMITVP